jgi:hypothetical protein
MITSSLLAYYLMNLKLKLNKKKSFFSNRNFKLKTYWLNTTSSERISMP